MDNTVYVLSISHRHGTDVMTFRDEESAWHWLATYCSDWWHEVQKPGEDDPEPTDESKLIEEYFRRQEGNEYYDLGQSVLL